MSASDVSDTGGMAGDAALARQVADEAGALLLDLRNRLGHGDPRALRAAGDRRAHELIVGRLAEHRPGDAVLSEEGADDPGRLSADRVWIVDPLDGTREYGQPGRTDWAVHVALWERGAGDAGLAAAAVALPAQGRTLGTDPPPVLPEPYAGPPRIVASRSRAPAVAARLAHRLGGQLVPLGSAGAKAAAVVLGQAEAYVHAGGMYEWDAAAPVAVALAAGLFAARLDGSPLTYNRANLRVPDLVICRMEWAPTIVAAFTAARLAP